MAQSLKKRNEVFMYNMEGKGEKVDSLANTNIRGNIKMKILFSRDDLIIQQRENMK